MSHATQLCPDPGTQLLSPADLDLYLETFFARWENLNTRHAYRGDLRAWLTWCEKTGRHPIGPHITRGIVEIWMRWLHEDRHNAPKTINHRVARLSMLFELAVDDGLMAKNPCRLVRRPKGVPDPNVRIAMNREETQRFIAAAYTSGPTDYALVLLMLMMGLRVSEVCSLDVGDCHEIAKAHRCVRFVGKGSKLAVVPMPPAVQRAVDAAIGDRTDGPLLVRRDGSRMTRRSADRVVKRIAKAAAITSVKVYPHVLRHTFIVGALDAGTPARTVQLSARHAQVSTTLTVYDRGRQVLDDHASYVVAGYFGAA